MSTVNHSFCSSAATLVSGEEQVRATLCYHDHLVSGVLCPCVPPLKYYTLQPLGLAAHAMDTG